MPPDALTELCGVNLVDRLLRILQRLDTAERLFFPARRNHGAEWRSPRGSTTNPYSVCSNSAKPVTATGFGTRPDGALPNCPGKRLLRWAFACRPVGQELSTALVIPIRRSRQHLIQNRAAGFW